MENHTLTLEPWKLVILVSYWTTIVFCQKCTHRYIFFYFFFPFQHCSPLSPPQALILLSTCTGTLQKIVMFGLFVRWAVGPDRNAVSSLFLWPSESRLREAEAVSHGWWWNVCAERGEGGWTERLLGLVDNPALRLLLLLFILHENTTVLWPAKEDSRR